MNETTETSDSSTTEVVEREVVPAAHTKHHSTEPTAADIIVAVASPCMAPRERRRLSKWIGAFFALFALAVLLYKIVRDQSLFGS